MRVLIRDRLVTLEEAALKLNIHEVGGDNYGPWVKTFLAHVGLPQGYSWCDAAQSFFETEAAGHRLLTESASVLQTWDVAVKYGWVAWAPARGDLVCYRWHGSGAPYGDHMGLVVAASSLGAYWRLQTIEGNTGPQSGYGRDGFYARTRIISKRSCGFVRIPGYVDLQPKPAPKPAPKPKPKPAPKPAPKQAIAKPNIGKLKEIITEEKRSGVTPKKKPAPKK